jgi:ElaB/YqjD/DUF883 family membrane-anchored ribosome-binding protein
MSKHTSHSEEDAGSLAEDARSLLAATADVAGEKVGAAREKLAAALDKVKKTAQTVDKAIQKNPYPAIAVAAGVGLLVGLLLARRGKSKSEPE